MKQKQSAINTMKTPVVEKFELQFIGVSIDDTFCIYDSLL